MIDAAIVVPARLQSQRFPEKLLHEINRRPLILWTAERIREQVPEIDLYFAVGEEKLRQVLEEHGFQVILTDPDLPSGTDRLAAANREIQAKQIINVQADEPLVTADHIRSLKRMLDEGADMATLATSFEKQSDFEDPNKVKVVLGGNGKALYFSRSPIPMNRDGGHSEGWNHGLWHLGLYGYTSKCLEAFSKLPQSPLESIEKLEQLRILENGLTIRVDVTSERTLGIDTFEDVLAFEKLLRP